MTAATTAGAASRELVDWHTIDWHKAHQNVRRLQARIVKATVRRVTAFGTSCEQPTGPRVPQHG